MKQTLAVFAALAAAGIAGAAPKKTGQRPNVILLMTDQHRFDYLGSVDSTIHTPNLDALAADGVRFVNGYTSAPSSTPARAGLLTGQSPWHHGLIGYVPHIAPEYPNQLPQLMTDAGYYSYGIGKMHWHPQRSLRGFAATELDESGRSEDPGFVSDYRQWFARVAPGLNPDSIHIGWNGHAAGAYPLADTLHPTWWTGERAVRLIEGYDKEQPLFLKVSFARPHSPYDPPRRFLDLYDGKTLPAPAVGDWDSTFSAGYTHDPARNPEAPFGDFGPEYAQKARKYYAANVSFIDEQIGRIIAALKEKGLYDNSVILFVSDHGDMLGDHYHWRKTYAYEGSAHVPFIVRYPSSVKARVERGSTREEVVEIRDILPTFLDAAGAPIPENVDGSSILNMIRNPKKAGWRDMIDIEHYSCYGPNSGYVALTDGHMKYIWFYNKGTEQLFDLSVDPYENRDLHDSADYAERLAAFRKRMAEHLAERGERWVSPDGQLLVNKNVPVKTPNFPKTAK
ncbi:arylsulfatase [uncultured Rikenella sp.]|uniref:arylsulfatase n=1 Tax=uncultured Rikenella sp. TaxID=368003 RepID=UPI0026367517|nr:arylsulfatase [uncultured Rikenella sp.]